MPLHLRIKDSQATLERKTLNALRRALDLALRQAAPFVQRRAAALAIALVQGTDEHRSLIAGDLLGELGVPNVETRLTEILNAIASSVLAWSSVVMLSGTSIRGSMHLGFLRSDYQDILGLAAASYVSAPSGSTINWLDWLVTQGDRIIVVGYDVDLDLDASERIRSRTGRALMTRGSGWHVPFEWSGTPESNFLTRAFDVPGIEAALAQIIEQEVGARLRMV